MASFPEMIDLDELLTPEEQEQLIGRYKHLFSKGIFVKDAVEDYLHEKFPNEDFDLFVTHDLKCELYIDEKLITPEIQSDIDKIIDNISSQSILELDSIDCLIDEFTNFYYFANDEEKAKVFSAIEEIINDRQTMSM